MPDITIEPFEALVVVVNGLLKSDAPQFDGLPAFLGLEEGVSYYIHAEYGPHDEILLRSHRKLPNSISD